jgi:hypothetical protein
MNPKPLGAIADPISARSAVTRPGCRSPRSAVRWLAVFAAGGLALAAAACGSSSSTTASTALAGTVVGPPLVPLQGCTYVLNGNVPAGEAQGIQPDFPTFAPDQAAQAAIGHIGAHGGTGLVYGFSLPSGVKLFAGPDTGESPVATVPVSRSIVAEDPLLWTSGSGALWLAFFIACGGQHLYWVSVNQIGKVDPATGAAAVHTIAVLESAAPYTQTGKASALPVRIANGQFVWAAPAGPYALVAPARGQLLGF